MLFLQIAGGIVVGGLVLFILITCISACRLASHVDQMHEKYLQEREQDPEEAWWDNEKNDNSMDKPD